MKGNNSIFLRRSFFPRYALGMPSVCPHLTTVYVKAKGTTMKFPIIWQFCWQYLLMNYPDVYYVIVGNMWDNICWLTILPVIGIWYHTLLGTSCSTRLTISRLEGRGPKWKKKSLTRFCKTRMNARFAHIKITSILYMITCNNK